MFKRWKQKPAPFPLEDSPWQSEDEGLNALPRLLVMLRPKAPFVAWVKSISPETTLTLSEARADAMAYLVPTEAWDPDEARDFVVAH